MMRRSFAIRGVLAATLAIAAGCDPGAPSDPDDLVVVDEGKADDYYSPTASEYYVEGTAQVTIEDALVGQADETKLARAKELMGLKTIAVGWFLNVRLTDKELTPGDPSHTDSNAKSYPGFDAIVRDGEYQTSNLQPLSDGKSYSYTVRLQVAGQKGLISRLPGTVIDSNHKRFTLQMGKVSNADLARLQTENEWFRDPQWDSGTFDPSKLPASQLEPIDLVISPQAAETDAYLDSNKLFADGKLTIDVHYGWDYWSRYDVSNAEYLYSHLLSQGFESPVSSFEQYDGSQPLTKTITANSKPVTVMVRIFHARDDKTVGADGETDAGGEQMEQQMYDSLASSEVIIFDGHSGDYYGFALANWQATNRGALDYPQLSSAKMPPDTYQIVMASGCDTFSIGQAFRDNQSKPGFANLNVITTNSFSNIASNIQIYSLLDALYANASSAGDGFAPMPVSQMLNAMNDGESIGSMFGLHGVDGDPRLHPFADLETLGQACTQSAQCGGEGNRCVSTGVSQVCAASCVGDSACPSDYHCKLVASRSTATLVGKQCLR